MRGEYREFVRQIEALPADLRARLALLGLGIHTIQGRVVVRRPGSFVAATITRCYNPRDRRWWWEWAGYKYFELARVVEAVIDWDLDGTVR